MQPNQFAAGGPFVRVLLLCDMIFAVHFRRSEQTQKQGQARLDRQFLCLQQRNNYPLGNGRDIKPLGFKHVKGLSD